MRRALPSLPHMPSWRSALSKEKPLLFITSIQRIYKFQNPILNVGNNTPTPARRYWMWEWEFKDITLNHS